MHAAASARVADLFSASAKFGSGRVCNGARLGIWRGRGEGERVCVQAGEGPLSNGMQARCDMIGRKEISPWDRKQGYNIHYGTAFTRRFNPISPPLSK